MGFEPTAEGRNAETDPLSYGCPAKIICSQNSAKLNWESWLKEETHNQKVMSLNHCARYWMDIFHINLL